MGCFPHEGYPAKHPLTDGVLVIDHIHERRLAGLHTLRRLSALPFATMSKVTLEYRCSLVNTLMLSFDLVDRNIDGVAAKHDMLKCIC